MCFARDSGGEYCLFQLAFPVKVNSEEFLHLPSLHCVAKSVNAAALRDQDEAYWSQDKAVYKDSVLLSIQNTRHKNSLIQSFAKRYRLISQKRGYLQFTSHSTMHPNTLLRKLAPPRRFLGHYRLLAKGTDTKILAPIYFGATLMIYVRVFHYHLYHPEAQKIGACPHSLAFI